MTILSVVCTADYIDSPPLRRNVQRALNRGRIIISYAERCPTPTSRQAALQDRTGTTDLGRLCARLLTNCIIYYNAQLLSQVRASKEAAGDLQEAALLTQVSPVAWQHLNFYGRYEFRKGPETINMEEIVQELAHRPVRQILEG
jgi:hypothetical protein